MGYNFGLSVFFAVVFFVLLILNTVCLFPRVNRHFLTFLVLVFLSITTYCKQPT